MLDFLNWGLKMPQDSQQVTVGDYLYKNLGCRDEKVLANIELGSSYIQANMTGKNPVTRRLISNMRSAYFPFRM